MKTASRIFLFAAFLAPGLIGCSKQDDVTPQAPTADSVSADASGESGLRSNETLRAGEFLRNGDFFLKMEDDGNLVLYRLSDASVRWSTGTLGNPGAYATMLTNGKLIVYAADGRILYETPRLANAIDAVLILSSDGILFTVGGGNFFRLT